MARTRANPPTTLPDDALAVRALIYPADGDWRIRFEFPAQQKCFDRSFSECSSLTGAQKTNLRSMLIALRDEILTLEGYV
jgi:hypothetical protein